MLFQEIPDAPQSSHFICLTEWFQQQTEFTTDFETMEVNEMNKCLSKFYVSVRKKDGSYYKRNSLLSVRAVLDRHLKSLPYNKKSSFYLSLFRYFCNHLSNYIKTIIHLRFVNIGKYCRIDFVSGNLHQYSRT